MPTNLDYDICIRRESGFCGIHWAPSSGVTPSSADNYDLSGDAAAQNVTWISFLSLVWLHSHVFLLLQGGTNANAKAAYIAIPGSLLDFYSGGVLNTEAGTAATADGSVFGRLKNLQ